MAENFLAATPHLSHLVYVSSDAVYDDTEELISERSLMQANSFHGLMHISREFLFARHAKLFAVVRPTLIYGSDDPHNGYGPNQFMRKAVAGEDIELFGNGEELRDHVHVEDVAELISQVTIKKSAGVYNAVSGDVVSFMDIAKKVIAQTGSKSAIVKKTANRSHIMATELSQTKN